MCMIACLLASLPRLLSRCASGVARPGAIVTLTLALVPAVMLSHLSHLDTWDARLGGLEAAKACLLFVLTVALLDSAARLRAALLAAAASILGLTVLAILSHHGLVNIPGLSSVVQHGIDGSPAIWRLVGTGVFNDPNDFALMLVVCLCISAYAMTQAGPWRWAAPLSFVVFAYALALTHSRGGMLALVAAMGAFALARLGWKAGVPVVLAIGLVMLAPVWGRRTALNLEDPDDTFQTRLDLWSASLDVFRGAPLFGIGQGKLTDAIGQVTHNSYLHAFAEMGLLGGGAFLGAFFFLVHGLWGARPAEPGLARLRPFVLAGVAGYSAGLLALSRCYTAPTQLMLGLGTAFLLLVHRAAETPMPRLDRGALRRLLAVCVVFLVGAYLFVRVMLHRGAA
jgi:O-antigen ligase